MAVEAFHGLIRLPTPCPTFEAGDRGFSGGRATQFPCPRIPVLALAASLLLLAGACKKNPEAPEAPPVSDSIGIVSVSPDQDVPVGVNVHFVVTVNHTLASRDSGELMVGFNNGSSPTAYVIKNTFLVARGSGQHVFDVTALTKGWGTSGKFGAYVNLSAHPHPVPWTPLVSKVHPVALAGGAAGVAAGASTR